MNYIELINKFWQIHEEHSFSPTEIALFFYLLKINNQCSWNESFKRNNSKIEADLGISFNTLKNARNKLQQSFVIRFSTQNGSPNVTYSITLSNYDKVSAEVASRFARGLVGVDVEVLPTKDKLNQTKQNLVNKPPDGIFYRIGNDIVKEKISEYFKRNNQVTMETMLMQYKVPEQEALKRLDDGYTSGYHFKDNNHLINSFRFVLKNKSTQQQSITGEVTVASKNIIKPNFDN